PVSWGPCRIRGAGPAPFLAAVCGRQATAAIAALTCGCARLYLRRQIWIASLLAMAVSRRAPHSQSSSPGLTGRPSIPETPVMESRSRGVLDTPLEPVIGLAEGETRWRGMTAVGARSDATKAHFFYRSQVFRYF